MKHIFDSAKDVANLETLLSDIYPNLKFKGEVLYVNDNDCYILINAVNDNGEPIWGRIYHSHTEREKVINTIAFDEKCVSIEVKDACDRFLIGNLANGNHISIEYNKLENKFKTLEDK